VVYIVGGRGDALTAQTSRIWAIDPGTGRLTAAGRLPRPVSDAALVTLGRRIVIAGGQTPSGVTAAVGELVPGT
jgi:hypothetical protein